MADFHTYLQYAENLIGGATKGIFAKIDQMTFKMVIEGLKRDDVQAVSIIIDQLVRERRPVSIPPLFVVAEKHPQEKIRVKAAEALHQLDPEGEVKRLTDGKTIEESVKILVEHYGNYKSL
ncbi:MAG TPA: hypothetical protein V6C81_24150 [Planktothrix sp.]|jgi:hypothetical protein